MQDPAVPRLLFSSPCGPYPKAPVQEDPVDFFYYRNTLGQGVFRLKSFQSWYSLHYLAQNLPVPSVVLENPSLDRFQREVNRGNFQTVAIGFTVITTGRVLAMVRWLKSRHPHIDVILGGYGTAVFQDPDPAALELQSLADRICRGEGVEFMLRYLDERWGISQEIPPKQQFLPMEHCFFRTSIPVFRQLVFLGSLGCTFGCPFCATSSQFGRRRILIASGHELFALILQQARRYPRVQSAIIYDEDFLMDRRRVMGFMESMASCRELQERPLLLTVFASLRSLRQYSMRDLIRCGIGTVYVGVESFQDEVLMREGLGKRDGDIELWFKQLHSHGINTLGSLIIGWDGQSRSEMHADSDRFVAMNPTFYQVVPLHPVPGTALWRRLKQEGRLASGHVFDDDSIGRYTFALKDTTAQEALGCVDATYRGLVAEGGPWPFRLTENLLRGCRNLLSDPDPVLRARAEAYRKMIPPVLPLALLSRVVSRGGGFRKRWRSLIGEVAREYPMFLLAALMKGVIVGPLLLGMYGIANLLHALRPHGDQPRFIRAEYSDRTVSRSGNSIPRKEIERIREPIPEIS